MLTRLPRRADYQIYFGNLSNTDQTHAGFFVTMVRCRDVYDPTGSPGLLASHSEWPMPRKEPMSNRSRKQIDAETTTALMKETKAPRQAASVKEGLEKNLAPAIREPSRERVGRDPGR
jgi:hypothetical protein